MIKNRLLNRASSAALTMTFVAATVGGSGRVRAQPSFTDMPAPAGITVEESEAPEPGHSYWNYKDFGIVLDVWNCPESGICMKVASVDPDNAKMKEFIAKHVLRKDYNPETGKFTKTKPNEVTREDVMRFCGFQPRLIMTRQGPDNDTATLGKWEGQVEIDWTKLRDEGDKPSSVYGLNIEETRDPRTGRNALHLHGYWQSAWNKLLFGAVSGDVDLTPAEAPQGCVVPKAPAVATLALPEGFAFN
jgi:hypothetical protein